MDRRGGGLVVPIAIAVGLLCAVSAWLVLRKDAEGRSLVQRWFGPEPREVEGRLLSAPPVPPSRQSIEILLCAGGDLQAHRDTPEAHSAARKTGDRCILLVEKIEIGPLVREADPALYRSAAAKAQEFLRRSPSGSGLVLDVDPEVPFVHITGVVDALKRLGLDVTIQRR
jgi:hypothetical protein